MVFKNTKNTKNKNTPPSPNKFFVFKNIKQFLKIEPKIPLFSILDSFKTFKITFGKDDQVNYLGNCRKRSRSMDKICFCKPKPQKE